MLAGGKWEKFSQSLTFRGNTGQNHEVTFQATIWECGLLAEIKT